MENIENLKNEVIGSVETKAAEVANQIAETKAAEINTSIDATNEAVTKLSSTVDRLAEKMEASIKVGAERKYKGSALAGDLMEKKEEIEAFKSGNLQKFSLDLKALTYGSGDAANVPQEMRDNEIQTNPHYVNSLWAQLPQATTSNEDKVRFIRETGTISNTVAGKAHGASFAETAFQLSNEEEDVVTVGGVITLNEEQLSDVMGLRSFVTDELMGKLMDTIDQYVITGSGTNQLNGLDNSGQHTAWADQRQSGDAAIGGANNIDAVTNAVAQLAAANYRPELVVMNPADFYGANFLLSKSSQNEYVGRQILTAAQTGVAPTIFGAPIFLTNAIDSDKYLVLDKRGLKAWNGEGVSIEFYRQADDFEKNNITARIKTRKSLTVGRASGIVYGDFSADRTTLAAAAA